MSYEAAAALQIALFQRLTTAPDLAGVAIYDAIPPSPAPVFVLVGPEEARDASDKSGPGAEHFLAISVIGGAGGFLAIKQIAARISGILGAGGMVLGTGRLVSLIFQNARARRLDEGETRRIDLSFRARIEL